MDLETLPLKLGQRLFLFTCTHALKPLFRHVMNCSDRPISNAGLNIYLLLAKCEVRTASYGSSVFLPFMAQARSARAMKTRKERTKIHNLPYGPSKRG